MNKTRKTQSDSMFKKAGSLRKSATPAPDESDHELRPEKLNLTQCLK